MAILKRCASGTRRIWATADPHGALKGQWGERLDTHWQSAAHEWHGPVEAGPSDTRKPGWPSRSRQKNPLAGGFLGQPFVSCISQIS